MDSRPVYSPSIPNNSVRSPIITSKEPPSCVQKAMLKERKPFTYTPGGLDLSEIKSEKMAKRLMRNAMSPGVQERPKQPIFTPTNDTTAPKSCHFFNLPVAVFPCIQIPPNPKELLRKTSGPYVRSESIDKSKEQEESIGNISNQPVERIENKTTLNEQSLKTEIVMLVKEQKPNAVENFDESNKNSENVLIGEIDTKSIKKKSVKESQNIIVIPKLKIHSHKIIKADYVEETTEAMETLKCDSNYAKCSVLPDDNKNSFSDVILCDLIIYECEENDTEEFEDAEETVESKLDDSSSICENMEESTEPTSTDSLDLDAITLDISEEITSNDNADTKNVETEDESETDKAEIERVISPIRRSAEAIKGFGNDLDNLPSLNICTKRFSFLRDSPQTESITEDEDDPFKFLVGIPPKISLIDRIDNKQHDDQKNSVVNKGDTFLDSNKKVEESGKNVNGFVSLLKNEFRTSPSFKEDDAWKENDQSFLQKNDNFTIKDLLKDDPEPAWKKEIREINMRKTNPDFQTVAEDSWSTGQNNSNNYTPSWSQTLRPKSWKERETERLQVSKLAVPGWKNPFQNYNKTPEITVEVINRPILPTINNNNTYVYPWESSPESSVAFSPEPRTPTPQSRNSPFSANSTPQAYYNPAVVRREYGTLGYQQPNRRRPPNKSCPIQSRSFKYLQLLTGTYENYEDDDEPFIPQPPQHAYPRPGNF